MQDFNGVALIHRIFQTKNIFFMSYICVAEQHKHVALCAYIRYVLFCMHVVLCLYVVLRMNNMAQCHTLSYEVARLHLMAP